MRLNFRLLCTVALVAILSACASKVPKPQPAVLGPNVALIGVRLAWSARVGEVNFPLSTGVSGTSLAVAGGDGSVAMIDGRNGRDLWRLNVGAPLSAGAGTDGRFASVVTRGNEVITLADGRELWRHRLAAQGFTAPFVAGGRVFVLAADRSVSAFDAQTGRRLWVQTRTGDALVLRQSGVMLSVGDNLLVGLGGRLVAMNPLNGSVRWEVPIASPRGTNDVERLVDLVGRVSRNGEVVCARAFQATVGCVNAARGTMLWNKPANGFEGVHGDDRHLYGTEADSKVIAWRRSDGERAWVSDRLTYRGLSAPLSVGRSVVVGDNAGFVHLLSREDGTPLGRVATDGSAVVAAPVLVEDTLIVVTRNGGVFGFRPE